MTTQVVRRAALPVRRPAGRGPTLLRRRARAGAALVSPAVALVAVFFVLPLGLTVWMSLHHWPLFGSASWSGIDNYRRLIHDDTFWHSLGFTAKYTALVTPIQLVLGYVLAVLVRRGGRGAGFLRTVFFMPFVLGFAAAAYMFVVMAQPGNGIFDALMGLVGLGDGQTSWLSNPTLSLLIVIILITWKTVGLSMILFMAAMHGIPRELYEAAQVDGAGWLRREWHLTVPLVRRTTALILVLTVTWAVLSFDQFYILTQGGPDGATLTTVMWVYSVSFVRYQLGYGAALSVALLLLLVVLTAAQLRLLRQETEL